MKIDPLLVEWNGNRIDAINEKEDVVRYLKLLELYNQMMQNKSILQHHINGVKRDLERAIKTQIQ